MLNNSENLGERVASLEAKMDSVATDVRLIMSNHLPHLADQIDRVLSRRDIPPFLGIIVIILSNLVVALSVFFLTR